MNILRTKNKRHVQVTTLSVVALTLSLSAGCGEEGRRIEEVRVSSSPQGLVKSEDGSASCFTLYAGQTVDAGKVCLTVDNEVDTAASCGKIGAKGVVKVTYTTKDGWELTEAHLAAGDSLADIPANKKGNPKIGNFPYNSGDITGATSQTFSVPLCTFGLDGSYETCDPVNGFFAAHAALRRDNGDGTYQTETGWADGQAFTSKGSWAQFFNFKLECCKPGFDADAFEARLDEIVGTSEEVGLVVQHKGGNSSQPYFRGKLDYDHDGTYEKVDLAMYCVDLAHTISSNTSYCARLYSSYDDVLPSDVKNPQNLDLVNYLMNTYAIGDMASDGTAFTGGDFQRTFWKLVYGTLPNVGAHGSGPSSNARVNELLAAAALNGEGYEPPCDGKVAVLVYPVTCNDPNYTITGQVLIAQMLVSSFDSVCNTCGG